MADRVLDDLEIELRRLPGVRAAGFDEREDLLLIQLHTASGIGRTNLPMQATRVAARHADRPVAVEVVRWRESAAANPPTASDTVHSNAAAPGEVPTTIEGDTGAQEDGDAEADSQETGESFAEPVGAGDGRARLLAVLSFPDTGEVEVHLVLGGRRTIGRAPVSGGLPAVVDATIEALRDLGCSLAPKPRWARPLDEIEDGSTLVAVALDIDGGIFYGLSSGSSQLEAAARSTLDALNRRLSASV